MTEKRFTINQGYNDRYIFDNVLNEIIAFSQVCNRLNEQVQKIYNLEKENEQLKIQNKMLSDELEQAKAVIDCKWSEYLKKKGDVE